MCQSVPASSGDTLGSDSLISVAETEIAEGADLSGLPSNGMHIAQVADDVRSVALEVLGDRYIDLWLSQDQQKFMIAVLDLAEYEIITLTELLSQIAPVQLVSREVSRSALDEIAQSVRATAEEGGFTSFVVDYAAGVVRVGVESDSEVASMSQSVQMGTEATVANRAAASGLELAPFTRPGVGEPTVVVKQEEDPVPVDVQDTSPLKGGKRIRVYRADNTNASCTAAFRIVGPGALTAGHCGAIGDAVYPGESGFGGGYGALSANSYWGMAVQYSDAARFSIPDGGGLPSLQTSLSHKVVGQLEPLVGMGVCFRGATTGSESCGTITGTDVTFTYSATGSADHIGHTIASGFTWQPSSGSVSVPGDSGGPAYAPMTNGTAFAVGIVSGHSENTGLFTRVSRALQDTYSTLDTWSTAPVGMAQSITGGAGSVNVSGWVVDPNVPLGAVQTKVKITQGTTQQTHSISAGQQNSASLAYYPAAGSSHGYYLNLGTSFRGSVLVTISYVDLGGNLGEVSSSTQEWVTITD
jgi:hypothetical protein